jgi:hypothetical protein
MLKLSRHFTIFGILISGLLNGQSEKCASSVMHERLIAEQQGYAEKVSENERHIQSIIARKKRSKTKEDILTIPIVVHVVHLGEAIGIGNNISEAQITSGITQLNDAFANKNAQGLDLKIAFKLAILDPNCSSTSGILRVNGSGVSGYSSAGVMLNTSGADEKTIKVLSKWSNAEYYNIWLVSEFDDNDGGGGTQGFAYFPGAGPDVDGAMIMNTAWGNSGTVNSWNNMGTTGIHEIGHALNLAHTFAGDNEGADCPGAGNLCYDELAKVWLGDCCTDTPPHKRSNSDCNSTGLNSCDGSSSNALFVNNYMDYSSQDCTTKFTTDQKARMRAALEGPRQGLLLSKALHSTLPAFSAPVSASCTPVTSADGLCTDLCGFSGVMLAEITGVVSHVTSNDGGYIDESGSCIKTAILTKGNTYQFKTNIWGNDGQAVAWIDFDNNGSFDSSEKIYDQNIDKFVNDSADFVVPAAAIVGSYVRMRVLCDLNSITSACHNPQYGQAEDYPVLVQNATSSVETSLTHSNIKVVPNPFTNQVSILNNKGSSMYSIIDITGKLLKNGTVVHEENINTSEIPSGVYFISIQNEEGNTSQKLVK